MASDNERIKKQLGLQPHTGCNGYFTEVWRGDRQVNFLLPTSHDGPRAVGSSIYFLLERPNFAAWHKHMSDEAFYWHKGGPIKVHTISQDGWYNVHRLGDILQEQSSDCGCQVVIPHDTWYAVELDENAPYCLYSAVVIPGFEFRDWTEGKREALTKEFPHCRSVIERLTSS